MSTYHMRVRVTDDGDNLLGEMWEKVVDDKITGYLKDDGTPAADYSHALRVEYIAASVNGVRFGPRAMIENPWAAA